MPFRAEAGPRNLKQNVLEVVSRNKSLLKNVSMDAAVETLLRIISDLT